MIHPTIARKDKILTKPALLEYSDLKTLYRVGAIASILQLVTIFSYALIVAILGMRVTSAEAFFLIQESSYWASLFRVDFLLMILVGLYLGNFPALVVSLWRVNPITTMFAGLFTLAAVTVSFAGEATFGLLHLGESYVAASSDLERSQLVAAGDALLAGGWWNSTGSYVTGILLQGGGVMISIVMLSSSSFSKITAWAGLIGNGFDLLQHLISPFAPGISEYLSFAMILYLIWYPMMARDLFRLAKNQTQDKK